MRKRGLLSHRLRRHQLITKMLRYHKSKWLRPKPKLMLKLRLRHKLRLRPRLKLKLKQKLNQPLLRRARVQPRKLLTPRRPTRQRPWQLPPTLFFHRRSLGLR